MIDLTKLTYHTAGYDAQGRPTLFSKPKPPEYATASPVSKRAYEHAAAKEFEAVNIAALNAAISPHRPPNWDKGSAVDRLTWHYEARRALAKGEL